MIKRTFAILVLLHFLFGFCQSNHRVDFNLPSHELQEVVTTEPKDSSQAKHPEDTEIFYPRSLQQNFREKYKGPEFHYHTVKPSESFGERLQKRLIQLIQSIFGKMDPNSAGSFAANFIRFLAILIAGFVIYLVIRFLTRKNGNLFFSKKNTTLDIDSDELHENIHEINFIERIADFELQKDYRSAVRYQFLSVLKKLNDQKILEWNPEKTNKDYISELKNPRMKEHFRELVYIFDYVWYGEFFIDEAAYQIFKKKFLDLKS